MVEFTFWDIAYQLLLALRWTVSLSVIAFVCGGLLGLGLLVLRLSQWPGAVRLVAAYVQIFQGTPLLMQIFLTYFGLALLGIDTSPMLAAIRGQMAGQVVKKKSTTAIRPSRSASVNGAPR